MKTLRYLPLVVALAAAPALAQGTSNNAPVASGNAKDFTWSGKLADGAWITVHDINGTVQVMPGTSDKVEVTATKRSRRGDEDRVRVEVVRAGKGDADVVICALWTERATCDEEGIHQNNNRGSYNDRNDTQVDFKVYVPKNVKVGAHSVNGRVGVEGAGLEVDASSVNGSVEVTTEGGPVSATTVNGSVTARMGHFTPKNDMEFSTVNGTVIAEFADDIDANIELETVNGHFATSFPVTLSGKINPRHLRATLGKGGPRLKLTTVNGNVELRKR